jgi:hypothetical protein
MLPPCDRIWQLISPYWLKPLRACLLCLSTNFHNFLLIFTIFLQTFMTFTDFTVINIYFYGFMAVKAVQIFAFMIVNHRLYDRKSVTCA